MADASLARMIEAQVDALGYELVELQQAGNARRPVLRLRIDREDSTPAAGVTVEECGRVSRALEAFLEAQTDLAATYTLEVSSPGVERPLVRRRDWDRFAGREIAVTTAQPLPDGQKRLEGELLGVVRENEEERIRLRPATGEEITLPLADVERAHLVFRWK